MWYRGTKMISWEKELCEGVEPETPHWEAERATKYAIHLSYPIEGNTLHKDILLGLTTW